MKIQEIKVEDKKTQNAVLFLQAAREVMRYCDACLYQKNGLSLIKLISLKLIAAAEGPVTASYLAQLTQSERHNITALIRRLERDGLITFGYSSIDRRQVDISITEKGQSALDEAIPLAMNIIDQLMNGTTVANILETNLISIRDNAHQGMINLDRN